MVPFWCRFAAAWAPRTGPRVGRSRGRNRAPITDVWKPLLAAPTRPTAGQISDRNAGPDSVPILGAFNEIPIQGPMRGTGFGPAMRDRFRSRVPPKRGLVLRPRRSPISAPRSTNTGSSSGRPDVAKTTQQRGKIPGAQAGPKTLPKKGPSSRSPGGPQKGTLWTSVLPSRGQELAWGDHKKTDTLARISSSGGSLRTRRRP